MASCFSLRENPELNRILKTNLPARRLLFIGGFALAAVAIVAGFQWNDHVRYIDNNISELRFFWRDTYWMLTVILFGLLFVLAPAMTALSFIQEKLRGTAIFQQMLLIEPFDIAVGKFLGSGAPSYVAALVIMPFALAASRLGHLSVERVFDLYLFLVIGGLSCQAVGLFVSAALSGSSDRYLRGGLLVGPAVGAISAVLALAFYRYFSDEYYRRQDLWHFYGITMEAYVIVLVFFIFIGVWAFAGAVRRIKASQLVPLKPWPVWLFFATAEALLVGRLWGWQTFDRFQSAAYGTAPISNLIFYMIVNWGALLALSGSMALTRNRLREAWSAGDDPLGLFQRQEIRNNIRTFLIALGVALVGLIVLWVSYHLEALDSSQGMSFNQLVPIALGFAFTIAGGLFFIQYSAMQRFRARAWAGVGLVLAFYLMMGVAGAMFSDENNTATLLNPILFAYRLTPGDVYMDRVSMHYVDFDQTEIEYQQTARYKDFNNKETIIAHGLIAEALLALGSFGLAFLKWRKLEEELLKEQTTEL